MEININRATPENAKEVGELFNLYRIFYKQKPDLELAVNFITERLRNDESVIYFAQDERGQGLGFTQLYPIFSSVSAQRSWVLNDLYVSEAARKYGVGKNLMDTAKEFVTQTNAKGIGLATANDNIIAQQLYESLGYKKNTEFINYFLTV